MTSLTVPDFLSQFPEFRDDYQQNAITRWITVAQTVLNEKRWGTLYQLGIFLYVAHNLVLYKDTNGQLYGLDTGQTVDGVTYTLDQKSLTIEGAATYNQTVYGVQFYQFAKMRGNGPISALASQSCGAQYGN